MPWYDVPSAPASVTIHKFECPSSRSSSRNATLPERVSNSHWLRAEGVGAIVQLTTDDSGNATGDGVAGSYTLPEQGNALPDRFGRDGRPGSCHLTQTKPPSSRSTTAAAAEAGRPGTGWEPVPPRSSRPQRHSPVISTEAKRSGEISSPQRVLPGRSTSSARTRCRDATSNKFDRDGDKTTPSRLDSSICSILSVT